MTKEKAANRRLAARGESRSYEGSTQSIRRTTLTRMAMGTRETDQPPLWIATSDLPHLAGPSVLRAADDAARRAPLRIGSSKACVTGSTRP